MSKKRPKYRRGAYVCKKCGGRGHNSRSKEFHKQVELPLVAAQPELKLSAA